MALRRAAQAVGIALLASAAGGCGDSAAVALPTATAPTATATATAGSARPIPVGYAGLGARSAAFSAAHRESAHGRLSGVRLVSGIRLDGAGRVTGYDVQFNDRPALSDFERLVSALAVGDLPDDRITVARSGGCVVYGSPSLKRLIGLSYARATTVPGTTTASVQSAATRGC